MIWSTRDCLFFTAMCLVTTSLSAIELHLDAMDMLFRAPTSSLLDILEKLLNKSTHWPVDSLGLEVTFHASASLVGIAVSLLAAFAKVKNDLRLSVPWLLFTFNGIFENQAFNFVLNTVKLATAQRFEPRVVIFHLTVLVMIAEEVRFWVALFREYIVSIALGSFSPRNTKPQSTNSLARGEGLDSGDHVGAVVSEDGVVDGGDKLSHGVIADQGDNPDAEDREKTDKGDGVGEQDEGVVDDCVVKGDVFI